MENVVVIIITRFSPLPPHLFHNRTHEKIPKGKIFLYFTWWMYKVEGYVCILVVESVVVSSTGYYRPTRIVFDPGKICIQISSSYLNGSFSIKMRITFYVCLAVCRQDQCSSSIALCVVCCTLRESESIIAL